MTNEPEGRSTPRTSAPDGEARHADLVEREEGANQEKIGQEANLRADTTPPGEDPDDPEVREAHDQGA